MLYAFEIAARYLTASKAQTALLVAGVAVGVFISIFISALIGGLAEFILSRTVGDISHITIEAETDFPALLIAPAPDGAGPLLFLTERGGGRTHGHAGRCAHLGAPDRGRAVGEGGLAPDHRRGVRDARYAVAPSGRDGGRAGARIGDPEP